MKKFKILGLLSLSLFLLSACGEKKESQTNKSIEESSVSSSQSDKTKENNDPNTATLVPQNGLDDGTKARAEYTSGWSEDWNGLTTKITKIVLVELTEEKAQVSSFDSKYLVQVYFDLINTTDKDFNAYPDQSYLVIDGQQVPSNILRSEPVGGEIMAGVSKNGGVTFVIPNPISVNEIKDIRLKWSADDNTSSIEPDSTKEFDVKLTLKK